jgi:hypothetical protein
MREQLTSSEARAERVQRTFESGLVIECETTTEGDNGMAQNLSYEAGTDLLVSNSLWRFMGPGSAQSAETIANVLNMYARGRGPYAARCVSGSTSKEAPDGTITEEPFNAVVITGPADQVTPDQVTAFSYAGAEKLNELLTAQDLGFELPLPAEAPQPQS